MTGSYDGVGKRHGGYGLYFRYFVIALFFLIYHTIRRMKILFYMIYCSPTKLLDNNNYATGGVQ
jgi:hypothetical protein